MRAHVTRRHALALMGSAVPGAAFGATYPDRQIKLVVALAAGGPADTAARVFAPHFSQALGQSVFIENRTGASSVVGTEAVVRAPPDGYTLLFGSSSSFAVNPAVGGPGAYYQSVSTGFETGMPAEEIRDGIEIYREYRDGRGVITDGL